jgi:hypothetical protein
MKNLFEKETTFKKGFKVSQLVLHVRRIPVRDICHRILQYNDLSKCSSRYYNIVSQYSSISLYRRKPIGLQGLLRDSFTFLLLLYVPPGSH